MKDSVRADYSFQWFTGDFNGDGKDDILLWYANDGDWRVILGVDNIQGILLKDDCSWLKPWAVGNWIPLIGDFNGDGRDDIFVWDPENGDWQVALSHGQQFATGIEFLNGSWLTLWAVDKLVPMVGDFNGDGKDDICVWNPQSGNWQVALSDGERFVSNMGNEFDGWLKPWAVGAWIPFVGDFNGDGLDDILVWDSSHGIWQVALSTGACFKSPENSNWLVSWAVGAEWTGFIGDVNGDGKSDVIVWNSAQNDCQVALSNGVCFQPTRCESAFSWLCLPEIDFDSLPLVGDFDGDGKADLLAYLQKRQGWLVARSMGDCFQSYVNWPTETINKAVKRKKITIYTLQQLKDSSGLPVIGGAERYIRDISLLMRSLGYEVEIFQSSNRDWEAEFMGFKVRAFRTLPDGWQPDLRRFDRYSSDKVFYGWYGLIEGQKERSIAVSHGIWWDTPFYSAQYIRAIINPAIKRALVQADLAISVDTSFLNYCRGTFPELGSKVVYIPNYVDLSRFIPLNKSNPKDKVTILYPRRLDPARGIDIVKSLAIRIMEKYPHVEFVFAVDRNHEPTWVEFARWIADFIYRDRTLFETYSFDEIPKAYRESDIVIIPTQWAEGTSLSCLEAMASGRPVVATTVGGLSDLVIHRFNGLLVNPDEESLYHAICELIEDQALRQILAYNALEVVRASFSKEIWEQRWTKMLTNIYS